MNGTYPPGVVAVQCPRCRKYMLVEAEDRGKSVQCLLCHAPIKVASSPPRPPSPATPK